MKRLSLRRSLARRSSGELTGLHDLWVGGEPPVRRQELLRDLRAGMGESSTVSGVLGGVEGAADRVFRALMSAPGRAMKIKEVRKAAGKEGIQGRAVRGALSDLVGLGLACYMRPAENGKPTEYWGVPIEVSQALGGSKKSSDNLSKILSLRGWLEQHFAEDGEAEKARKMYRFLADDSALCARIDALDKELQVFFRVVAMEYGGVLPLSELADISPDLNPVMLRNGLEEASLGTLGDLDFEPFGIRHRGPVAILFNEAVLAFLQRAARNNEIAPSSDAGMGVGFVSNFSRFASFVEGETVRFTVRGSIFKSTGKRIAQDLIPNPGREFRRFEVLELEYRFARAYRYIDKTGMRSFRLTEDGKDFLGLPLLDKQRIMLDWLLEDRDLPGDLSHQLLLRRTALRYLKRLDPEIWYDAMALPFVARNHYLALLGAEENEATEKASFPVRSSADLKSLSWNLFTWIRKYLYLLGIVDVGYDENGRACGIRLTPNGAELLGILSGRELAGSGHLVVNPDFEVVLFPDKNSHQLVYMMDRFADRELTENLFHYRITPGSLHRGLAEGLSLEDVLNCLAENSRTPVPQNVSYSLESWAKKNGSVAWNGKETLSCDAPEILDRLSLHPQLRQAGFERVDSETIKIQTAVNPGDLSNWVQDFGVLFQEIRDE